MQLREMVNSLTHIPINDPFHLLKNGRSHLINHPLMIDPNSMRITNMSYFEEATDLNNVLNDRSSISAMKDSYPLNLFSWETLVKLLQKNRFDGAFYCIPFVYLIQAIKSLDLNRKDRLKLLESAIKIFFPTYIM